MRGHRRRPSSPRGERARAIEEVTGSLAAAGSLKDRLSRSAVIGGFVTLSPAAVEIMAWRGYETLCIDGEHALLGPSELEAMVRAADASGVPCLVRVPAAVPWMSYALDAGAAGVLVPRVESEEQARECASLARYAPTGIRGAGPGRASKFGQELARRVNAANDDVILAVQVETLPGVRAAAAIAAVEGVDVVFIGPGDLAVSLGCEPGSDEHTRAIISVLDAAARAGTLTGIFCRAPEQMRSWLAHGVRLFLLGGDAGLLGDAAADTVAGARAVLAEVAGDAA
jgi:4-hydroxy-2-oxoheptanedioate aldolase